MSESMDGVAADVMRNPKLSNPNANLSINSLYEIPNIVSNEESVELIKALDNQYYREWTPEGYDRRHRVQRYCDVSSENDGDILRNNARSEEGKVSMEEAFGWIFDRFVGAAQHEQQSESNNEAVKLHRPFEVVVTEHTPSSCRSVVNTFEQNTLCPCRQKQQKRQQELSSTCNCYIAQLTLLNNAIESIEKPLNRELECWDLALPTDIHETKIVMEQNGLVFKTGESLWNWRGRISEIQTDTETVEFLSREIERINLNSSNVDRKNKKGEKKQVWTTNTKKLNTSNKRCIVVTFRGIRQPVSEEPPSIPIPCSQPVNTSMGQPGAKPAIPLSKLLTIIVTTSPIRSHPSTDMLETTFATFPYAGNEFAYDCHKVIVCDGCRVIEDDKDNTSSNGREEKKDDATTNRPKITRKYSNVKQTLRNGIATSDQAKNYTEFKCRLRNLCEKANRPTETTNPFRNTQVVELEERHGYGFALRHALYHCVNTPYVCVIQHDRTFMRPTPIHRVVSTMDNDPQNKVKYVGMSMRSNLMYHDIFSGKYGRRAVDEYNTMILRPKELCIGDGIYGAEGTSVQKMIIPKNERLRKTQESLAVTYRGTHQYLIYDEQSTEQLDEGYHQLSLSPTVFWYDNTHIVQTAHYRDFIFNPQYKMVARGGFVEDKLSPCMVRSCERLGLTEGHAKFGCYLLDDHSGTVFTGHLDGGSYMSASDHYNKDGPYAAKMREGEKLSKQSSLPSS